MSIVDSYSKYCIKVFDVTEEQSAKYFIELLEEWLIGFKNKPVIIHTDYGVQFNSIRWYDFSLKVYELWDIRLSLGNVKSYNTYATNYFIRECRQKTLYQATLNIIDSNEVNEVVYKAIEKYNNSPKNILNNKRPKEVYLSPWFNNNKVSSIITTKCNIPYNRRQEYIEMIKLHFINKLEGNIQIDDNELSLYNKEIANLSGTISKEPCFKKKVKVNKQPRHKRDIISSLEFNKLIDLEEVFLLKNKEKIYRANTRQYLQIKILMILLFLSGCRVSELTCISFKNLRNILKEATIRV